MHHLTTFCKDQSNDAEILQFFGDFRHLEFLKCKRLVHYRRQFVSQCQILSKSVILFWRYNDLTVLNMVAARHL